MLSSGNQAIAKGLVAAGATYMAGYPITPASDIMLYWLEEQKKNSSLKFIQTEDEIAAIHHCIGASLAGSRSFTATSGPGFSLMQEGLGLAFAYEAPLVLVNVMRQGPSTGMPTLFSQDNLLQTQYGSHGDYTSMVFYPNSVEECFQAAVHAVNASCETSSPTVLLSDAYLARLYESASFDMDIEQQPYPFEGVGNQTRHFTGLCNDNGKPDTKNQATFIKWINHLRGKVFEAAQNYEFYDYLGNKNQDTLIISFGSISRVVHEWQDDFAIFRPMRIFPVLEKQIKEISQKYKNIVIIEGNCGQYHTVLQSLLQREVKLVKVLGGVINPEKIRQDLAEVLSRKK